MTTMITTKNLLTDVLAGMVHKDSENFIYNALIHDGKNFINQLFVRSFEREHMRSTYTKQNLKIDGLMMPDMVIWRLTVSKVNVGRIRFYMVFQVDENNVPFAKECYLATEDPYCNVHCEYVRRDGRVKSSPVHVSDIDNATTDWIVTNYRTRHGRNSSVSHREWRRTAIRHGCPRNYHKS